MTTIISSSDLVLAVQTLQEGKLVAFPTDTVYGVAASALQEGAVQALYQAKSRPAHMAIPVMVASPDLVTSIAQSRPGFWTLAEHFWPGPLTIILPKAKPVPGVPALPDIITAHGDTVGLRIPDHPIALKLLRLLNTPLAVTSANRSGQLPARSAEEAFKQLEGFIRYVVDGGLAPGGQASTIVDLTQEPPRILRQGPIPPAVIARILDRPVQFVP